MVPRIRCPLSFSLPVCINSTWKEIEKKKLNDGWSGYFYIRFRVLEIGCHLPRIRECRWPFWRKQEASINNQICQIGRTFVTPILWLPNGGICFLFLFLCIWEWFLFGSFEIGQDILWFLKYFCFRWQDSGGKRH